jgi:hypothetical protein
MARLGERRREAKLYCQCILEKIDRERQQQEHCAVGAFPEDKEAATLH